MNRERMLIVSCLLSLSMMLTTTPDSLAEDPLIKQEFSVSTRPPVASQKFDLTVKDGSILDFGRKLAELRSRRGFPLLYDEYDSLVEDGVEGDIEVFSKHKVNLNLRDAPLWDAVAAICNQMDMGLKPVPGGYLALHDFSNTFDYWTSVGPMLMTFRVHQSDDLRIESIKNPADADDEDPLQLAIYALDGEAELRDIRLRDVSLISDKNKSHPISVENFGEVGKWYCKQDLPIPPSKISGIEGKIIAIVAKQLLTLRLRPGQQTYSNGPNELKITVTDVEESPVLDVDGTKFEPHEKGGTMYYFRVELRWVNGLSTRERQQIESYFSAFPPADIGMKQARQYQKLLNDKMSYRFIDNGNCSPSPEALEEFNSWAPGEIKWATSCNHLVGESQDLIVLHLFSDDESEIRTCHELQFARDGLLIDSFQAKRSTINNRHLKVELVE